MTSESVNKYYSQVYCDVIKSASIRKIIVDTTTNETKVIYDDTTNLILAQLQSNWVRDLRIAMVNESLVEVYPYVKKNN